MKEAMTKPEDWDTLSDAEKRGRVAQLDGWHRDKMSGSLPTPVYCKDRKLVSAEGLPDYLHDMNAIRKIVMDMNELDRNRFWLHLGTVVLTGYVDYQVIQNNFERVAEAPPEAWAKALVLMSVGKSG